MIIDGNKVASDFIAEVKKEAKACALKPHLVAILVGSHPASLRYVNRKKKACEEAGMRLTIERLYCDEHELENSSSREIFEAIKSQLERLNRDSDVDAILLQLPLPKALDAGELLKLIDPKKDVDGLSPSNLGKLVAGDPSGFIPCTPLGIIRLLEKYDIDTSGKRVVIIGRSQIVGRPLSLLLSQDRPAGNATVTIAHSKTKDLKDLAKSADILVVAVGHKQLVNGSWLKPGAVVIDVGINESGEISTNGKKRLIGDVDFGSAIDIASAITPVPGGVGPMTIASLLTNTLRAYKMGRAQND